MDCTPINTNGNQLHNDVICLPESAGSKDLMVLN